MEKYNLTYLTVDSIQEGVGLSQIVPLLIGLTKMEYRISLISFEKVKPSNEVREIFTKAGINWVYKDFKINGPVGGVKRLLDIRRSIPDTEIVHGRSDIATVAGLFSRVNAPVLWDVRSLWSDQRLLIKSPGWNQVTARGARTLENLSASRSTALVTLTSAVVPILQARHYKIPQIRGVIPTCVQLQKFVPAPMPKSELTCLLSGTFNNYYDLDRTREIIAEIRKSTNLKVIWARGSESPRDSLGVGEDLILSVSNSEMPKILRESHFGMAICTQLDPNSLAAAVPTKIAEFLASGRPVIVSKGIGDLDSMLGGTQTGIVVDAKDTLLNVSDQIIGLVEDKFTPERCREVAIEHFDMNQAINKYANIYERMQE